MSSVLYNELAPYYDMIVNKNTKKEVKFLDNIISDKEVSKVLDLACGNGRHSNKLQQKGYEVIGIDLSKKMLKQALKKDGSGFLKGNIKRLPLKTNAFDCAILLWSTINLFPKKDVESILSEANRCLKEEAYFVLDAKPPQPDSKKESRNVLENEEVKIETHSVRKYTGNKKKSVYNYDIHYKKTDETKELTDKVEMKLYTPKKLKKMLIDSGFKVVEKYGKYNIDSEYNKNSDRIIYICRA